MINPTIQGLTARQLTIANLLWSFDTEDQVHAFIKALPTDQDRKEAASLVQIMIHEYLEEVLEDHAESAQSVIDSVR